jgi:UDP-glucose 4-epimerase
VSRVLVTGATSAIGNAIVRRLLSDPAYDVRVSVSEEQPAPRWMREGCEVHTGDLRDLRESRRATAVCSHVIHLAASAGADAGAGLHPDRRLPHTLLELNNALQDAVIRAALELDVERFAYVSSALVFERASEFPTTEAHLPDCPAPRSAAGFSELAGEFCCRAAHDEHGLQYTICRPCDPYGPGGAIGGKPVFAANVGPEIADADAVNDLIAQVLSGQRTLRIPDSGEQTRTPTHVDDVADGIITAIGSPQGLGEDFNIAAARELTVAELARIVWAACGKDPADFALAPAPAGEDSALGATRHRPSVEKASELLGWQARIGLEEGIAATVASIRERGSIGSHP